MNKPIEILLIMKRIFENEKIFDDEEDLRNFFYYWSDALSLFQLPNYYFQEILA